MASSTSVERELSKAIHDLCQPLTTLQCRLELAELLGTPEAYREGIEEGLAECRRMMAAVNTMRAVVQPLCVSPMPSALNSNGSS
jgi:signal transduction histidine kinase